MSDRGASVRPLATGWATVDLDRAAVELGALLVPGTTFIAAAPCAVLGARCRVGRTAAGTVPAEILILLEPSTEGRLAATLARHGEGWCATWERDREDDPSTPPPVGPSMTTGPLGPERLVRGSPVHGPYRLLVAPATIGP